MRARLTMQTRVGYRNTPEIGCLAVSIVGVPAARAPDDEVS